MARVDLKTGKVKNRVNNSATVTPERANCMTCWTKPEFLTPPSISQNLKQPLICRAMVEKATGRPLPPHFLLEHTNITSTNIQFPAHFFFFHIICIIDIHLTRGVSILNKDIINHNKKREKQYITWFIYRSGIKVLPGISFVKWFACSWYFKNTTHGI